MQAKNVTERRKMMKHNDRGAAMVALVLLFAFLFLAFGIVYVARIARMADQMDRLQIAADASALAGADALVEQMPALILADITGQALSVQEEQAPQKSAQSFALKNNAKLATYSEQGGTIAVTVQSQTKLESGKRERADARATIGKEFASCDLSAVQTALNSQLEERARIQQEKAEEEKRAEEKRAEEEQRVQEKQEAEKKKENDAEPISVRSEVACGDVQVQVSLQENGSAQLLTTADELKQQFDVHLVQ